MEIHNLEAVLGASDSPDAGRFRVKVARSGFERVGSFRTDNPLLQRINSNLEWAQQNNLVGKPTDTPSREKNGWTGDTMADSETQSLIWDVRRAHEKYLRSFPDGMISTGQLPMILPAAKGGYGYDQTPGWNLTWQAVPAWDSAFFVMPWEQYEQYGTTSLFAELYDHQDRLLRYYETLFTPANNYTFNASLGAYSGAEPAGSNAVISQQFYIYFADYMARVGRMIGKNERADHYAELAKRCASRSSTSTGTRNSATSPRAASPARTPWPSSSGSCPAPTSPRPTRSTSRAGRRRRRTGRGWPSCSPTASSPRTTTSSTTCTARATSSTSSTSTATPTSR